MSIQKVQMFTVICDNCKESADEGSDYSCWELKRKLVGFEINKGYYDNACKCLEEKTRILTLW